MTFLVHVPAPPLDRVVERFYCPTGPMPYRCEYVMPATSMDLKINFGKALTARRAGSDDWMAMPSEGWCMGIWDTHHSVTWPEQLDYIGVSFRPGGFFSLFGIEAQELSNDVVGLDALFGRFGTELRSKLADAIDPQARFAVLEAALAARVRQVRDVDRVFHALEMLRRSEGMLPIAQLASSLDMSHKHLVTLFNRVAGAPPKTLARLYRFQHLLGAVDADAPRSWTSVAHDFGFYDQAHFNKEFKRLTGHTPASYAEQRKRAHAANPQHAKHRRLLPQG